MGRYVGCPWYSSRGFLPNGTYFMDGKLSNKYNDEGFDCYGIHQNGTKYDSDGFNSRGFNKELIHKNGTQYDEYGFNEKGYHQNGTKYDNDGISRTGFNKEGFHQNGTMYNEEGYNQYGYNEEGYDKNGYDYGGFNKNGYDYDGFNKEGFHQNGTMYNEEGYNEEGYDKNGYDYGGFNKNGYDYDGFNKSGVHWNGTMYDSDGFNKEGFHENGTIYDKNGRTRYGLHYNRRGFFHALLSAVGVMFLLLSFVLGSIVYFYNKWTTYSDEETNIVTVKYREIDEGFIDLSKLEKIILNRDDYIEALYYDDLTQYAVIKITDTYYHYCGVPREIINIFDQSGDVYRAYNQYLFEGEYDCRKSGSMILNQKIKKQCMLYTIKHEESVNTFEWILILSVIGVSLLGIILLSLIFKELPRYRGRIIGSLIFISIFFTVGVLSSSLKHYNIPTYCGDLENAEKKRLENSAYEERERETRIECGNDDWCWMSAWEIYEIERTSE